MDLDFWHTRWENKETGWHRDDVHPLLEQTAQTQFPLASTIFAPLCGKSLDMLWLVQRGYKVIGSELSELAVNDFFSELNLKPEVHQVDGFKVFQAGNYTIYQGDFFELKAEYLSTCNYWYDRAAVIALPEEMRNQYVSKIFQLFEKGTQGLLISLSYLSETRQGPPFSLLPDEIETLWSEAHSVKHLNTSGSELGRGKGAGQLPRFKPVDVEEHAFEIIL